MKRKSQTIHYGNGQYCPAPNGRGFDARITVGGVRHRARLPDEYAARAWLDAADADTPLASPLTRAQMLDAQDALYRLPPGVSLTNVINAYIVRETVADITTADAVDHFLANRERRVKKVTLLGYRSILRQFAASCPEALADITPRHIEAHVSKFGKVRHNATLTHIKVFLRHCVDECWISTSPAARLKSVRVPEPPKGILSVADTEALLRTAEAEAPRAVPYLVLGLFAGIRPAELLRLTSGALRGDYIALTGADTKTADARTIRIRPNLAAWLAAYPPAGPIATLSLRRQYKLISSLRKAAGLKHWPSDCMRHSFATYAYEIEKDAAHIAAEMGHHGTDVFFRHYRALTMPGEGKKFFAIFPSALGKTKKRPKNPTHK